MEYWHQGGKWERVVWEKVFFWITLYISNLNINQIRKVPISSPRVWFYITQAIFHSVLTFLTEASWKTSFNTSHYNLIWGLVIFYLYKLFNIRTDRKLKIHWENLLVLKSPLCLNDKITVKKSCYLSNKKCNKKQAQTEMQTKVKQLIESSINDKYFSRTREIILPLHPTPFGALHSTLGHHIGLRLWTQV